MIDIATMNLERAEDRACLADFLVRLAEHLRNGSIAEPPPAPTAPGIVYGHAGTDWPALGAKLPAIPKGVFTSSDYLACYQQGETVRIYAAGCAGLRNLASTLDLPLRKIGATCAPDVRVRIGEISRDRYASLVNVGGKFVQEAGFDNYLATQIVCRPPDLRSPVVVEPRSLSVRLPSSLTFDEFERALQAALTPTSLHHWISSAEGAAHLKRLRLNATMAHRFTDYKYGGGAPVQVATEIQIFRPRMDGDNLVRLIEHIVLKALSLAA